MHNGALKHSPNALAIYATHGANNPTKTKTHTARGFTSHRMLYLHVKSPVLGTVEVVSRLKRVPSVQNGNTAAVAAAPRAAGADSGRTQAATAVGCHGARVSRTRPAGRVPRRMKGGCPKRGTAAGPGPGACLQLR